VSEEKSYCKRCNKELVYCGYLSKVDKKLICSECFEKEQPKYLFDKISDLEKQLAESEERIKKASRRAYSIRQTETTLKIRRQADEITAKDKAIVKLKQQLKMALEDFNEIQKEHDKLCDMVVEKDKKIELLNKELSNECDEHLKFVGEADSMVKDLKKAFRFAIFELDFARHHSQSTTTETMERIERLTNEIWQKAMKIKGEL